jgi:1-acyl-sn-glycerol-3-phosphate acyltransferase
MKWLDKVMGFLVQSFFKVLTILVFNLLYRTKYINGRNIPSTGGCVVAPNHSSFWDPPLIGTVTFRRVFKFMARDTLFKTPVWGTMLGWMGAFPVKRGTIDRKSWAVFVNKVKNGECVMFFPEGTRTPDGEIQPGKPGTGMLIYKAKAKVIPVYAHGLFDAWPKGKKFPNFFKRITVLYGEPMDLTEYFNREESKQVYIEITARIMDRIKELKKDVLARLAAEKKK